MRPDSLTGSHRTQSSQISSHSGSFALKEEFNSLFGEARAIDRIINPHPMIRMPVEIIREIFEAAARADPDMPLLLTMTCMAWKRLAIETSRVWSNIKIDVSNHDMLETLQLSLLLSKNWPLDIAVTGSRASDELLNELAPHAHRIRSLELSLRRKARVPFRVLGRTPPEGLSSLCRLAIESASYSEIITAPYAENNLVPSKHPLERAKNHGNTVTDTDLFLIKSLPLLSSLTALILHAPGVTSMVRLQLPRVESLRLRMKDAPTLLENLMCNNLKTLDVVLDDTSREGWWVLLVKSLAYPRLESLALDVTLDRPKNEWSKPWDSRSFTRLPPQSIIKCVVVALSFSDREYLSVHTENTEYLCGDLLRELTESLPSLKELRLLHVPFLHAPFIWPSSEVLYNLQKLELQVPANVRDEYIPVIELPNLQDLRYYGIASAKTTQLPRLRTPSLEYLEIIHHIDAIHPILVQVDRHWPNMLRRSISYLDYSKSRDNSSRDFPMEESLPNPRGSDLLLPIIHQSTTLRELRFYVGTKVEQPRFDLTYFPELRALHCSTSIFYLVDAPMLEELHLLWSEVPDKQTFCSLESTERMQKMLRRLIILDVYSHINPRSTAYMHGDVKFGQWMPHLKSLQTLILGHRFECIDDLINCLWRNPRLCPMLTTIDSFEYPQRWSSLRDCIEKRNHLAMEDASVCPIYTLRFPLALHRNISDRLKESLSGEFAAPFEAIPHQPFALEELMQPNDKVKTQLDDICLSCLRSGNAFECLKPGIDPQKVAYDAELLYWGCPLHWNRGPDRGVTITAYNRQLSGYLEVT
jgi:hypothetical protein